MNYQIRPIEKRDDAAVEAIIRACLIEYGANHAGTAWEDPDLCRFSEIYGGRGAAYFVAQDEGGRVVGGVGIGALPGVEGVCELQKMYCLPEARGTGVAGALLAVALEYARGFYTRVYLETLPNMYRAHRFYEKHGFCRSDAMGATPHFACDVRYVKEL